MQGDSIRTRDIVVITDPGSVDPDDIFALILLTTFPKESNNIIGVVATHFYSDRRAKLAKLILSEIGRPDIKVYVGNGIKYSTEWSQEDHNKFLKENELFPKLFGYPINVKSTEKEWFPNFMKGYYDIYGSEYLDNLNIEDKKGHDFLIEELRKHSQLNKLTVISLSPMHDLAMVPVELYSNMEIYAMGGGFDQEITPSTEKLNVPKAGYNWGICPNITSEVLKKLSQKGKYLHLITSETVRRNGTAIPLELYTKWETILQSNHVPKITRAIMLDWLYCNKGNKLSQHKNLCDPLTLFLALCNQKSKINSIRVNTTINHNEKFDSYLDIDPNSPLLEMTINEHGNTNMIIEFDNNNINYEINSRIESVLFPHNRKLLYKC